MVRLFYQIFAALALISGNAAATECIIEDWAIGGDGGNEFHDDVKWDTNISGIVLRTAKRIDAVGIVVDGTEWDLHGGTGGTKETIDLNGKKIVGLFVQKNMRRMDARIFFVKFILDDGSEIQRGSYKEKRKIDMSNLYLPPVEGAYLIGFKGQAGKEIDALGGMWLDPKCAKKARERQGQK